MRHRLCPRLPIVLSGPFTLLLACGSPGGADSGMDGGPAGPDLALPPRPFDWVAIAGTGQSLSVGAAGTPVVSTKQPYHNLKLFDSGPPPRYPLNGGGMLSLVPLTEPFRPVLPEYEDGQYPGNIAGETPHSGMANQISTLSLAQSKQDYVTLHSAVGWSGHCIADIDKSQPTTRAYPGTLSEARTFKKMADAAGKKFGYGAIILTHGECDSANPMYEAQVKKLYTDYNTDLKAITGQTEDIPLLLSQQSSIPGDGTRSLSTVAEWKLGVDNPGHIICVGPKYQYAYAADHVHLEAAGYVRLGEKHGEVYYQTVVLGRTWKPLQPRTATHTGAVITLGFDVPVPPMNWDENISQPHQAQNTAWAKGRGFEVADNTGPLQIDGVAIKGETVEITLQKAPAGTGLVVRYAMTQDGAGAQGGQEGGRRGQLRDSDELVGYDAEEIPCQVTNGSATVKCSKPLSARAPRDVVTGGTLGKDIIVTALQPGDQAVLSKPFGGASGPVMLTFHHDLHNYAVHFEMPVP